MKAAHIPNFNILLVRMKGLEPTRLTAPDPKSGSATNYDTSAFINRFRQRYLFLFINFFWFKDFQYGVIAE